VKVYVDVALKKAPRTDVIVTNKATVTTTSADSDLSNNEATAEVTIALSSGTSERAWAAMLLGWAARRRRITA
jgi:hypothetical protein